MAQSFLLLYIITNETTLKLTQIDRLLAASKIFLQKHVRTTLVGIPVVIYTLVTLPPQARVQQATLSYHSPPRPGCR